MSRKEFKILIAISDTVFAEKVVRTLSKTYTIYLAKDLKDLSAKVHQVNCDLVVIDYHFCGMKAEDIYQGMELLHPNSLFIVYTQKDKKDLAMKLWKRRAFDYITYTRDTFSFVEEVHKCVRWTIQKTQVRDLRKKMDQLSEMIRELGQKIEQSL
ncbi:MAG: response regulator [Candidatus Omnitrophica bacterium]|nr:response regulator [Candidatus Omnitrophota bacterium]